MPLILPLRLDTRLVVALVNNLLNLDNASLSCTAGVTSETFDRVTRSAV